METCLVRKTSFSLCPRNSHSLCYRQLKQTFRKSVLAVSVLISARPTVGAILYQGQGGLEFGRRLQSYSHYGGVASVLQLPSTFCYYSLIFSFLEELSMI